MLSKFSEEDIQAFKTMICPEASEAAVARRKQWDREHPLSPLQYLQWLNAMHRLCQVRIPAKRMTDFNL